MHARTSDRSQPLAPPLQFSWATTAALQVAAVGNDRLYGINQAGNVVAFDGPTGQQKWQSSGSYIANRLARQGQRLFAYKRGEGLAYIDDQGTTAAERVAISFGASDSTSLSNPVVDDRFLYIAVNQGMLAISQDNGLQFGKALGNAVPYSISLLSSREVLVVDGHGVPSRYHVGSDAFELVWAGNATGDDGLMERPFLAAANRVVVGVGAQLVAYDADTGEVVWRRQNTPARSMVVDGDTLYVGFHCAAIWALRLSDGSVRWQRQFLNNISLHRENRLILADAYLYWGGTLQSNPDGAITLAIQASDGALAGMVRGIHGGWCSGLPISDGQRIFLYGSSRTGAYRAMDSSPHVGLPDVSITPRPLQGPSSAFGTGTVSVSLLQHAQVTIAAYRETAGLGHVLVDGANWNAGNHEVTWSVGASDGFSDSGQMGYVLVEVTEDGAPSYTQGVLVPINTFPDILWHWAKESIELMLYYKYVSGYPNQTFRPDSLVNRAESSAIIAKTLGLQGPTPGFHTKFTDIATHWARPFIMALEERQIINGFQEADGTFTFRPDLNMTRAQEARIFVNAYSIPSAPPNFATRFTDIAGHWAEADIKSLENAGYVTGFRESDGTYTYRPNQNLTRAELCTVVVRIRRLTR